MSDAWEKDAIITQEDRELLAQAYEEGGRREQPYHTYADLAREGHGAFTLCSLRAIARARMASTAREAAAWRAGRDAAAAWHAEQAAQWERIDKSHGAHKRHLSHAANIRALTPPGDLAAAQGGE